MSKLLKNTYKAIKEFNLSILSEERGGKHYKLIVGAPDGRTLLLTTGGTPGDHRAMLNERAALKRFAENRYADDNRSARLRAA